MITSEWWLWPQDRCCGWLKTPFWQTRPRWGSFPDVSHSAEWLSAHRDAESCSWNQRDKLLYKQRTRFTILLTNNDNRAPRMTEIRKPRHHVKVAISLVIYCRCVTTEWFDSEHQVSFNSFVSPTGQQTPSMHWALFITYSSVNMDSRPLRGLRIRQQFQSDVVTGSHSYQLP